MAKKRTGKGGASAPPADENRKKLIAAELKRLEDRRGRLTPEIVVDAARDRNSILHEEFDWDDRSAAQTARLHRARQLITYITIFVVVNKRKVTVPAYVKDPRADYHEQGYVSTGYGGLMRQDAEEIMVSEFTRCEGAIRRAQGVVGTLDARFPGLSDELEALLQKLIGLRSRVESGPKGKRKGGEARPST